jgi:dienelactone hydrolase
MLEAPGGVRFALLGGKPSAPAPTLFVLAGAAQGSLESDDYNKVGRLLAGHGFLCVSLDLPCHGADRRPGEPEGLSGWRVRLEKGTDFVAEFNRKASAVLDYLVREKYTDPRRVAACGTSRGGFLALHFAAAEPRVRAVAAFAPVTDLLALREFAGMDRNGPARALGLAARAEKLAGRPLWLCIGNDDGRVGTDLAIAFTRRVVRAGARKPVPLELHVLPTVGHTIHATAHQEAAAWLLERMREKP